MGDFFSNLEEALRRLNERGFKPPWDAHPQHLHFALYAAGELSTRVRLQLEKYLYGCSSCKKRSDGIRLK